MSSPTPPPDGAGQRLAGFSHAELYRMAHGGDPEAAGRAGQRLARVAETLRGVSSGLERAAAGAGVDWTGQASQAAQGGVSAHAGWARAAGRQAAQAGAAAAEQAASARNVIAQMPTPAAAPPGRLAAAAGPGGFPVAAGPGGSPVAANLGQVEQAQDNARMRAVELLRGHAEVSARSRPAGTFATPAAAPGTGPAGAPAARGSVAGRAPGPVAGPVAGRAVPSGGPGPVSRVSPTVGAARGGGVAGGAVAAGARSSVPGPARPGPAAGTGAAGSGAAGSGAAARGSVGGAPGPAPSGPVPGGAGSGVGRRTGPAVVGGPEPAAGGQAGAGRRPVRPADAQRTRSTARGEHPAARGGEQPLPGRPPDSTRPQGAAAGHEPVGPGPGGQGAMAPPMAGPAGERWPEHERPGYLLDDQSLFDGEDPVAPPVLGGRAPRPSNPWETR